jgi:hypothetical protein
MRLSGAAIGTYRPQYRPLSAIRYLDVNSLPIRYTLFISLGCIGGIFFVQRTKRVREYICLYFKKKTVM